ncbi:MAG: MBL fold metallo-hydrolase, partial [Methanomicrobia archaeon]|nr:MBL fold metallo-hydrolase [Methanomicrobia archaeon]
MKFYTLASGSKGNATLVVHQGQALLIDMGLTLTLLKERLQTTPYNLEHIQAILYTHNHSDHLKPLKA